MPQFRAIYEDLLRGDLTAKADAIENYQMAIYGGTKALDYSQTLRRGAKHH